MAQTRRIQTSVLGVAYEDGGPSDGQPVVLLHREAPTDFAQAIVDVGVKPQEAQTTDIVSHGHNAAREQPTVNLILAAVRIVREWRRRSRSRRELAQYADHERSDLGCAADLDAEIAKPFWRE